MPGESGPHQGTMTDATFELTNIDPGIRRVVAFLRAHGFDTWDSGDGVSKGADPVWANGGYLDVPHVLCHVALDRMVAEADRMHAALTAAGVVLTAGDTQVEANYSPADGLAVLALYGVNDDALPELPEVIHAR